MKLPTLALLLLLSSHLALASQALINAARNGDLAQVTRLIGEGDNVNDEEDRLGETALIRAASRGHIDVVNALLAHPEILINQGSRNYNSTALMLAAYSGRIEVVHALLAHPKILINPANHEGWTALMLAARNGHIEVVNALLARPEILINQANIFGCTALIEAASDNHTNVVRALLDSPEILVNHADRGGNTALTKAASEGNFDVIQVLLARSDILINQVNYRGQTAFMVAVAHGHRHVAESIQSVDYARSQAEDIKKQILEHALLPQGVTENVIIPYLTGLNASKQAKKMRKLEPQHEDEPDPKRNKFSE